MYTTKVLNIGTVLQVTVNHLSYLSEGASWNWTHDMESTPYCPLPSCMLCWHCHPLCLLASNINILDISPSPEMPIAPLLMSQQCMGSTSLFHNFLLKAIETFIHAGCFLTCQFEKMEIPTDQALMSLSVNFNQSPIISDFKLVLGSSSNSTVIATNSSAASMTS